MALNNKLASKVQPLLPPGTEVQQVILSQTGPNPWFFLITYLFLFAVKYRYVVVAPDAIYVVQASKFRVKPKELVGQMPRATRLGPVSGLWSAIQVLDERHWVHRRFYKAVEAADAVAPQGNPAAQ